MNYHEVLSCKSDIFQAKSYWSCRRSPELQGPWSTPTLQQTSDYSGGAGRERYSIVQTENLIKKTIMPRVKSDKLRAPTWNANGGDAAQLFRDCHFGKYSDKTPYNEIHNYPSRKYSVYNAKGFVGHCKKMLKRVL
jgi:hypothetical protein